MKGDYHSQDSDKTELSCEMYWDFLNMVTNTEIFENLSDISLHTVGSVVQSCKTLKEIIEEYKGKEIVETSRSWE
jgi:hypothetical protein